MSDDADFDRIEDLPVPRERGHVVGHLAAQAAFLEGFNAGRLHHAWLLSGAEGIGKATLAFQMAQFMMRSAPAKPGITRLPDNHDDEGAGLVRQLAHPDFMYVRRTPDPKTHKMRKVIVVDDIRDLASVFNSTSGVGGWRVAIIDTADDFNANSANALLKLLEEPPKKSLFLIISHSPARLLPTIRSRCRKLALEPLAADEMGRVLDELANDADPGDIAAVISRAEGSARRALTLLVGNGIQLIQQVEELLYDMPGLDVRKLHTLGDTLAKRGAEDSLNLFLDTVTGFIASHVRAGVDAGDDLVRLSRLGEVEEAMRRQFATVVEYNLDMKQFVISSMSAIAPLIVR